MKVIVEFINNHEKRAVKTGIRFTKHWYVLHQLCERPMQKAQMLSLNKKQPTLLVPRLHLL